MWSAAALAPSFPVAVRQEGESYVRRAILRFVERERSHLVAQIGESHCSLERHATELTGACDCRYYRDFGTGCSHLWALLVTAERNWLLSHPRHLPILTFQTGSDESKEEEPTGTDTTTDRAHGPLWEQVLEETRRLTALQGSATTTPGSQELTLRYELEVVDRGEAQELLIHVAAARVLQSGRLGKLRPARLRQHDAVRLPDPADRRILALLRGGRTNPWSWSWSQLEIEQCGVPHELQDALIPDLCRTGRAWLRPPWGGAAFRLPWDDGPPWDFAVDAAPLPDGGLRTDTLLVRGDERRPMPQPALALPSGFLLSAEHTCRVEFAGAFELLLVLKDRGAVTVPAADKERWLAEICRLPAQPRLLLPPQMGVAEVQGTPIPVLRIRAAERSTATYPPLRAELGFLYEDLEVAAATRQRNLFHARTRRILVRDREQERARAERLRALGLKRLESGPQRWELKSKELPGLLRTLLGEGWRIEAQGKLHHLPGAVRIDVRSGIDWFELHGGVQFGEQHVALPALLTAVRKGRDTVALPDGSLGVIPAEFLRRLGVVAGMGESQDDHVRFRRSQAGLLDALLAAQPEARCDAAFTRLREELAGFGGIAAGTSPEGFSGTLRPYQLEGLGWMAFLRRIGFGGCLADDMGLGKTVQVLALLLARKHERPGRPSLVVVPRSLLFNWQQEAARFTPGIQVLAHDGNEREASARVFGRHDLVLTTYGILRRDILALKDMPFDYVVLDEATAVKTADTETAKAVRLLQADHRLALSGTPIENHLGELWSLFEFLNPGMLGTVSRSPLGLVGGRTLDGQSREFLARALRPFILRRTKAQVAPELPERLEQTIFCDLDPVQRRLYDELRAHYRASLGQRIAAVGLDRAKIHVLEALLRLRQAALHPGLLDKARLGDDSAKLEMLRTRLGEALEEGSKALVFSQFTSMLAIVRDRLDKEGVKYEYLDGRTRDREARVRRFQEDPECRLFLISLKAGGLGLNLTAADVVFLLDPWWNPAVEAQAIDRAHRIGQVRKVFAFRLVARGTVEEKVLELQRSKRDLADAILREDNSVLRSLTKEDLELLL